MIGKNSLKVLGAASALLLATTAGAQQFTFDSSIVHADPGSNLSLPIYLSGVTPGVAALNFTVRVSNADAAKLDLSSATSTSPLDTNQFIYSYNSELVRTGVSSGNITGDVVEFRGVIYPETASFAAIEASAQTEVATLVIPVDSGATGEIEFELVSDIDNDTGLLGVSDESGNSLVPASETRPLGDTKRILVNPALAGDFVVTNCVDLEDFLYLVANWQITTNLDDFLDLVANWQQGCS